MDNHRPIGVERHRGVRLTPGWRPLTHGDAATDVGGFGCVVTGRGHGGFQGLLRPYALVARPYRALIAFGEQVLQPKIEWVYAKLPGNAVDLGLDGEDGLRLAWGAHEAAGDGVGIHLDAFEAHMRYLIGPAGLRRPTQVDGGHGLEPSVGAAVEQHSGLMRHQGAVALDPGFELDNRRVAGIAGGQLLDVVHDYPHRAPRTHRPGVSQGNVHGGAPAPVVAAHCDRIQTDAILCVTER